MLKPNAAIEQTRTLLRYRAAELDHLDRIHAYLRGKQPLPISPAGVPNEVRRLAEMSRVNVLDLVISAVAQSLYVDGYRAEREPDDAPAWDIWQANQMDARQTGVHRGALSYGVSYVTVLPGDTAPVIRGYAPRRLTAVYGEDDLWPMFALRAEPSGSEWLYRLYDEEAVYFLSGSDQTTGDLRWLETRQHDVGVCPVVRFLNTT
ncbi:MAG: phage portal protein, partial [Acidobacteria bacterium]|nr:phage portal protein [Acidobacteriota bacterium]